MYDLLNFNKKTLEVRENRERGIYIEGLSEFDVISFDEAVSFLVKGDEQKAIAETNLNTKSSRSHTVFRVNI